MLFEPASRLGAAEIARVGDVLLAGPDAARRAEAARLLGECGNPSAYAWLRRGLWDHDEEVRVKVVDAIGELDAAQALGELAALYAWSGPRVRRAIVRAAARLGAAPGQGGVLVLAAEDPDRRVRALASRAVRAAGRES